MAERKVTVLNPAGYQEQLPDTDNLLISATPSADLHAANKLYVDTGLADLNVPGIEADLEADIAAINTRIDGVEANIDTIEADITAIQGDISDIQADILAIETNYATKAYVDQQDTTLDNKITQEASDRAAADQNLQDQIDVLDARQELQTLDDVTTLGNTTDNDMTSTGTITAAVLVGDIDQGEY